MHDRSEGQGGVENECADAKGATDLVAADGHGVSADLREIHRNLTDCLHCVGVERNSGFPAEFGDSPHRLDGSDLVVCPHDSAEGHITGAEKVFDFVGADPPLRVDAEPLDARTLVGPEPCNRIENGVMLDRRCQDSRGLAEPIPPLPEQALDRQIVRLGSARGEDDGARASAEICGDALARLLDDLTNRPARSVQGRGVSGHLGHLHPTLPRRRDHRRGRGMVQIGPMRHKAQW